VLISTVESRVLAHSNVIWL